MPSTISRSRLALWLVPALTLLACSGTPRPVEPPAAAHAPRPGSLAYDREVWHALLADHQRIRREVVFTPTGVEATTESDDPAVAAQILDHAQAMQRRMQTGSQVRVWDPVFADLFRHHDRVTLSVTATAKGVRIVESSDDPEVVKLLHAHAAGVSDFVREGFEASARETPRSPQITITRPAPAGGAADPGVAATPESAPAAPVVSWTPLSVRDLSDAQRAQRDRGVAARDQMFARLFMALGTAVQRDGPASAIRVCKDEAPRIAAAISAEHGVRIGRTSDRLRNAGNAGPAWTSQVLHDRPESERYAVSERGELGITLPIRMSAACVACHGPTESIAPAVQEALASSYPADRATGFNEGDLRGWFWVEVPPGGGEGTGAPPKSPQ